MSIKIKKCPTSNEKVPTKEDFLISASMHISDVQKGCAFIANKIIEAGINHDYTKITLIDDMMETVTTKSADEFYASKWYQEHITKERHHLHKCPDDVTLIDVIECLIDCVMAAMARKGDYTEGPMDIEILQKAYLNTAKMLKSKIILEDEKHHE